jgi:hypothetical protein
LPTRSADAPRSSAAGRRRLTGASRSPVQDVTEQHAVGGRSATSPTTTASRGSATAVSSRSGSRWLSRARRRQKSLAVLFLDLDR